MSERVRLQAFVHGYVQGVSFRWYTRREASALGLVGYVRNRPNGSVEIVAEGEREEVQQLLAWLQHGPTDAVVDRVDATWSPAANEFTRFEVRY